MRVEIIKGHHLTSAHRRAIKLLRENKLTSGRIGRTDYFLTPNEDGTHHFAVFFKESNDVGQIIQRSHKYTLKIQP